MMTEQKKKYLPPLAELTFFVPQETISTLTEDEKAAAYFTEGTAAQSISIPIDVVDPDFPGFD